MKIAIDLGHGVGQDRGAEGIVTEESIINSVGSLVIAKLKTLGHNILVVRPSNASSVGDSLEQRVNASNSSGADLFVCIHANAGGGQGTEIFTYEGKELSYAKDVLNNLTVLGFKNRGIKSENFYVINHTNAKAMLIEICFVDTQSDVDLYNSIGDDAIADAIVKGLVGQTCIGPISPAVVVPSGNNWIKDLQTECNRQGYSNQAVDGISGPNTINGCPLMRRGSCGKITRLLQQKLVDLGYNTNGVDSVFGGGTHNAVIAFQKSQGLVADGVVGKNTWKALLGV